MGVSRATAQFAQTAAHANRVTKKQSVSSSTTPSTTATSSSSATVPLSNDDDDDKKTNGESHPDSTSTTTKDTTTTKPQSSNGINGNNNSSRGTRSARVQTQAFIDKTLQQQQAQQQQENSEDEEEDVPENGERRTYPSGSIPQQPPPPSPSTSQSSTSSPPTFSPTSNSDDNNNNPTQQQQQRLLGDWELVHGNYLLRPKLQDGPPRAVIHFLGGAIVGAAPHVSYRYLLEQLAARGYLVVATPYDLSFDHLQTCDAILQQFEQVAPTLARTYGALPVVGLGHSTGALLQLLITSLFPDTPRAANALVSYNNRPISEAVPLFDEVFEPFFRYVVARNDTQRRNGARVIAVALEIAKSPALGQWLPRDELINKALRLWFLPQESHPASTTTAGGENKNQNSDNNNPRFPPQVKIPAAVREAANRIGKAATPTLQLAQQSGLVPPMLDVLQALDQIPNIMEEVADGARDFCPSPSQVQSVAKRAYRARNTLVIQYNEDSFDQSDQMEALVRAAGKGLIRNKRPMLSNTDDLVKRVNLPGGHDTPLRAPPSLDVATRAEDILGAELAVEQVLQYRGARQTVQEICQWLEECNI